MQNLFSKILFTKEEILASIKELSKKINHFYKDKNDDAILVISVLDGSVIFTGHLLIELDFPIIFKTAKVSVYGDKLQADENNLVLNLTFDPKIIKNKNVLILEDIIDSGVTLDIFKKYLKDHGAKDVNVAVLFNKLVDKRAKNVPIDFIGLNIPNVWVAGFGLDGSDELRNFPHLGQVDLSKIK